jgi:hypothetical protein
MSTNAEYHGSSSSQTTKTEIGTRFSAIAHQRR